MFREYNLSPVLLEFVFQIPKLNRVREVIVRIVLLFIRTERNKWDFRLKIINFA